MHALAAMLLALALLAPSAAASEPFSSRSGGAWAGGTGRGAGWYGPHSRAHPGHPRRTGPAGKAVRLDHFQRSRRSAARVRLLETSRDAERRVEEGRLLRHGTLAEVAEYQRRVRTQDQVDRLRFSVELVALDRAWLSSLGPTTRRVLVRSALMRRRLVREHERELRIQKLEKAVEGRPPAPPFW